jgi:hypothetical protein
LARTVTPVSDCGVRREYFWTAICLCGGESADKLFCVWVVGERPIDFCQGALSPLRAGRNNKMKRASPCGFATALVLALGAPNADAVTKLRSQSPCVYDRDGFCLAFGSFAAPPNTLRTLDFIAPGPGQALVMVHGSGYCENSGNATEVAEFDTQIVNDPNAAASYQKAGGNKFKFTLFPYDGTLTGNTVFNLAAQRLFTIQAAGVQHFALNLTADRFDADTFCGIESIALTVLFTSG